MEKWQNSHLAFIWVEVLWFFLAIKRDAFHHAAIVPSLSVIVAQYAENSISLQRPVATHHQPSFSWAVTFLPCKDMKNDDATSRWTINSEILCVTQSLLIVIGERRPPTHSRKLQLIVTPQCCQHCVTLKVCVIPASPGCRKQAQGQRVAPRSGWRCFWVSSSLVRQLYSQSSWCWQH